MKDEHMCIKCNETTVITGYYKGQLIYSGCHTCGTVFVNKMNEIDKYGSDLPTRLEGSD